MLKDNLKALRIKFGYTQQELAKKMRIRQYNISDYEIGRIEPNVTILIRYADTFHVSIDYLVGHNSRKVIITDDGDEVYKDPYLSQIKEAMQFLSDEKKRQLVETVRFIVETYK